MSQLEKEIKACVLHLLIQKPFFGFLIGKMDFIEVTEEEGFSTAATDGKNIYYNAKFFNSMTQKEKVFVLAHEVLHCVLDSFGRRHDKDPEYWNMATDYIINDVLKTENVGTMPKEGLWDSKYHGWIAEEVYNDLKKKKAKKQQTLDLHIDADGKIKGKDKNGNEVNVTMEDLKKNAKGFKKAIIEAAQRAKMAGHSLGGVDLLIQDLINPKINWKQLLLVSVQSMFKSDLTWQRPNRRNPVRNMILPTLGVEDTVDICVSIDTSGSITDEQRKVFISEILGILNYYRCFKLKIWCFDTTVHNMQEYDEHTINQLDQYKPAGGGGTSIECNYDFMKEQGIKPKQFICLTDGYNCSNNWGDENYCPVVWIIHSNKRPQVPFGQWAIFEELTGEDL